MSFYADLHIHSKYSRACSRDCDLEHLSWWAQRKGIALVGTGDFTHPAWRDHLGETLVPAEPGLFRLRDDLEREIARTVPVPCRQPTRFMLSVEISTIYKRDGRTRKVHHLVYFPDLDSVDRFNRTLGRIGNLGSDGRPILGLDSRDLLAITLESSSDGYLVPAHVWTPWFSALGSKSGFDTIADCYADLAGHIFALETGLSSDPPMNWRVSSLDGYRLVSNSDAHSPPALGREASTFDTELDYYAVRRALATGEGYGGSLEFFPEEGKYHLDGHRACDVRFEPEQTRAAGGRCPKCGKPLTVGVLHRVGELADRAEGHRPNSAAEYRNLVPLPEIMGEILGVGPRSKSVTRAVDQLVARHGPELSILGSTSDDELERSAPLLAEAVRRLRRGEVVAEGGYDGEYGVVRMFAPEELRTSAGTAILFDVPEPEAIPVAESSPRPVPVPWVEEPDESPLTGMEEVGTGLLDRLDRDQRAAASAVDGPVIVVAGPGTGKTRTLTHRVAHLVRDHGVPPERCLAITFTRRAAAEMSERLAALLEPGQAERVRVCTFHALGGLVLRESPELVGLSPAFRVADETERLEIAHEVTGTRREPAPGTEREQYEKALRARDLVDFDDLVRLPATLLEEHPDLAERYRQRWPWVSVDEYQDVDEAQYRLLRQLVAPDGDLYVIGDPDQAIYRFRGADVGFFLRFEQDFPAATTRALTRNYRSTAPIVAAAAQAIAPTSLVRNRMVTAVRQEADAPRMRIHRAPSAEAEATFVARTVDQLLGGSSHHALDSGWVDARETGAQLSYSDIAVLYRTDAQAGPLVAALTQAGVPFQKGSHDRLVDRPGVRAIAHELRVSDAAEGDLIARLRAVARALAGRLPTYAENAHEQNAELHAAVDLLVPLAERCAGDQARLLAELAMGTQVDVLDPRADRISLLTLHAAKGLEFPVVFLVGCEDGLVPLRLPGRERDADELAEERRLFFVGLTRAQSYLFVSHADRRARHGSVRETRRSPFLDAIDAELVERFGDPPPRRPRVRQQRLF